MAVSATAAAEWSPPAGGHETGAIERPAPETTGAAANQRPAAVQCCAGVSSMACMDDSGHGSGGGSQDGTRSNYRSALPDYHRAVGLPNAGRGEQDNIGEMTQGGVLNNAEVVIPHYIMVNPEL